jgi:hypothetical protein
MYLNDIIMDVIAWESTMYMNNIIMDVKYLVKVTILELLPEIVYASQWLVGCVTCHLNDDKRK